MPEDTVTILLVDDDKVDTRAIRRSLRALEVTHPVIEASDGLVALDHLRGTNGREQITQPCLVLLDLNMPRMGGIELLDELRKDPSLSSTLVFVMTTSAAEEDRVQAYRKNIAGYVLKHRPGVSFVEAVSMFSHYCRVIEFPNPGAPA